MSELRLFYHEAGRLKISKSIDTLKKVDLKDLLWIDLNDVSDEIETELEQFLKIYIQEEHPIHLKNIIGMVKFRGYRPVRLGISL